MIPNCSLRVSIGVFGLLNQSKVLVGGRNWSTSAGIIHVENFYSKNLIMFVTKSNSQTEKVVSSEEGDLEWIPIKNIGQIYTHEDIKLIVDILMSLKPDQFFTAVSKFDNSGKLLHFKANVE